MVFWPELPKIFNFVWTFDKWRHVRWCIRYDTIFIEVLKSDQNWAKKLTFRLIFTPQEFVKWKTFLRYIYLGYVLTLLCFYGTLLIRKTQCLKILLKFKFSLKWNACKFTVLVRFGALFTDTKPKILLKTRNFKKHISLGISNNISPRSQKKSHNSCKNNQNKLGPKLGINRGLKPRQRLPEILT